MCWCMYLPLRWRSRMENFEEVPLISFTCTHLHACLLACTILTVPHFVLHCSFIGVLTKGWTYFWIFILKQYHLDNSLFLHGRIQSNALSLWVRSVFTFANFWIWYTHNTLTGKLVGVVRSPDSRGSAGGVNSPPICCYLFLPWSLDPYVRVRTCN